MNQTIVLSVLERSLNKIFASAAILAALWVLFWAVMTYIAWKRHKEVMELLNEILRGLK